MISADRIRAEFERLASFDSESYEEYDIKEYLKNRLVELGLEVCEDTAFKTFQVQSDRSAGNLYGSLKGNITGEPVLFSAHMDTVSPGKNKKLVWHDDGRVTSDKTTVLGADDISGLVSILEALQVIKEENLSHTDLEVVFSVAEEPFCKGIAAFDFDRVRSKIAYVLDLTGKVGTAAVRAPTILSMDIWLCGKAAHSGFSPEEGINALTIAANALSKLKTGRVDTDTTVNFGLINGGTGKNIVPDSVHIQGEIRSLIHEKALAQAEVIERTFREEARLIGGEVKFSTEENLLAYDISEDEPVRKRFEKAVSELFGEKAGFVATFGGSDGNYFNKNGIKAIVAANAMENVHTVFESTSISELVRSAELTLKLMTLTEE
ncbi:MAG: M20/M25/M40 family metallo-hydrolase [Oscillospiraceae bacterium]|nr:M20/M25/M40 family metallo-hydrolase [Oscillospiraceae bacterium]